MALTYLSGVEDQIGKKKKEKKDKKDKKHTVAKIGLVESRAAVLAMLDLNLFKLATKVKRVYDQPAGKTRLEGFWKKFGGDFDKFKKALGKGTKQQISGDSIGIATEALMATALPIIVALVPILKEFKAGGDATETGEFDDAMNEGSSYLQNNSSVPKTSVALPSSVSSGIIKGGGAKDDSGDGAEFGSFCSLTGIFFTGPLVLPMYFNGVTNIVLLVIANILMTYMVIGMIPCLIYYSKWETGKKYVSWYVELPLRISEKISSLFKMFARGKKVS